MRDVYGNSGMPVGWGMQPEDDPELTWTDRSYQGGCLRIPPGIESGGPVVATPVGPTIPEHESKPYRGFIGQCWCGRTYDLVTPDMVKRLDTFACRRDRCQQIAAMSPRERRRHRPRPVAHMGLLRCVYGTGSRRRSGTLAAAAYSLPGVAPVSSGPEPPGPGDTRGASGWQSGPPVSHTTGAPPDSPDAPPTDT